MAPTSRTPVLTEHTGVVQLVGTGVATIRIDGGDVDVPGVPVQVGLTLTVGQTVRVRLVGRAPHIYARLT